MEASECKQVIVVRLDLKMGRGKTAAQVAHASLKAAEQARGTAREWYDAWTRGGEAKVVLKVRSLSELLGLKSHAEQLRLPLAVVGDKGFTQLPSDTVTCIGIGPAPSSLIDKVTGHLKLL